MKLFCPKCGLEMSKLDGRPWCSHGDMQLSPKLATDLHKAFSEKPPDPIHTGPGTKTDWFCPACSDRMELRGNSIVCPGCERSLDRFEITLVEFHPHRGWPLRPQPPQLWLASWWASRRGQFQIRHKLQPDVDPEIEN